MNILIFLFLPTFNFLVFLIFLAALFCGLRFMGVGSLPCIEYIFIAVLLHFSFFVAEWVSVIVSLNDDFDVIFWIVSSVLFVFLLYYLVPYLHLPNSATLWIDIQTMLQKFTIAYKSYLVLVDGVIVAIGLLWQLHLLVSKDPYAHNAADTMLPEFIAGGVPKRIPKRAVIPYVFGLTIIVGTIVYSSFEYGFAGYNWWPNLFKNAYVFVSLAYVTATSTHDSITS